MKHIIVPATSANMGSGFDSVGIAFQKYNHLWYVEIDEGIHEHDSELTQIVAFKFFNVQFLHQLCQV